MAGEGRKPRMAAAAQMQPGLQAGGEPGIARDHQSDASRAAEFCDGGAEFRAIGCRVVPKDDAA